MTNCIEVLTYFISFLGSYIVGNKVLKYRYLTISIPLAVIMFSFGFSNLMQLIVLYVDDYNLKLFFSNCRYFAMPFIPIALFGVVTNYINGSTIFNKKNIIRFSIIPICTIIALWTNPIHHMFYENIEIINNRLIFINGTLCWAYVLYNYLIIIRTLILIFNYWYKNIQVFKKMVIVVITLTSVISIITLFQQLNLIQIDLTVISFWISVALFNYIVVKILMLEIMPINKDNIIEVLDDSVFVYDKEFRIIDLNNKAKNLIFNCESLKINLIGKSFKTGIIGFEPLKNFVYDDKIELTAEFSYEINEVIRHFNVKRHRINKPNGTVNYWIVVLRDNTELIEAINVATSTKVMLNEKNKRLNEINETLYRKTVIDELTGSYNYKYIKEYILDEIEKSNKYSIPFSIVMIDIDFFKKVNDRFGHATGNVVLIEVVRLIKNNLTDWEVLGRYGGEEFIIILDNTKQNEAFIVVENIRILLSQYDFGIKGLNVTISSGVHEYKCETFEELIANADKKLYFAKQNGRNRVVSTI